MIAGTFAAMHGALSGGANLVAAEACAGVLAQSGFPEPMGGITLAHYLFVSAVLFTLGLIGFVTRRNLIVMFLCTELMFQGAGVALVAFGRYHLGFDGQTFVIFVLTVAAAEAAMALALVVLLFRQRETLSAEAWREMRG